MILALSAVPYIYSLAVMVNTYSSERLSKASSVCMSFSLLSHSSGRTVHFFLCALVCHISLIHLFIKHLLNDIYYVSYIVLGPVILRKEIRAY